MTIVAFMGLAFDSSYFYYEKRRVQTAADAGALAGAQELTAAVLPQSRTRPGKTHRSTAIPTR